MKATTSIDIKVRLNDDGNPVPGAGKPESELRAAARRHGLNLKELAVKMGAGSGSGSAASPPVQRRLRHGPGCLPPQAGAGQDAQPQLQLLPLLVGVPRR